MEVRWSMHLCIGEAACEQSHLLYCHYHALLHSKEKWKGLYGGQMEHKKEMGIGIKSQVRSKT